MNATPKNASYEQRLTALTDAGGATLLAGGLRGVEKESLRITGDGLVSRTPHPAALGSALTHKYITTDYSEALPEFVTTPELTSWAVTQLMCDLHQYTYPRIGDEMLWPLSMPCRLRSEDDIPIAQYGSSNVGRMKSIYREGLGNRYGRYMQAIAGIHYNYSLPEAFWPAWADIVGRKNDQQLKSDYYLGVVRNVRRIDWLILYLYGASPALCKSFMPDGDGELGELDSGTWYGRYATSLRMSDLGYQNSNQASLHVCANSLDQYVHDLSRATATLNPEYQRIGVKVNGEYLQLNANQLQIENEFYSSIRPKRVIRPGERPTAALQRGGIEYVELRALDLSPFDPIGISNLQQLFLEAYLIYCLINPSPGIDDTERWGNKANHLDVARRGRDPDLKLVRGNKEITLQAWARRIVDDIQPICAMLDEGSADNDGAYMAAHAQAAEAVNDAEQTWSGRLLGVQRESRQSFADFGLGLAGNYREYFLGLGDDFNQHLGELQQESVASLARQQEIETADTLSLDEYLARYFA
ncbi:MAG: glutamate--cysteine ligase [Gammaproteobacteria bacterium]|nr:glutamate--cysteine ligase [Gammaproteobacteria bacterium]